MICCKSIIYYSSYPLLTRFGHQFLEVTIFESVSMCLVHDLRIKVWKFPTTIKHII